MGRRQDSIDSVRNREGRDFNRNLPTAIAREIPWSHRTRLINTGEPLCRWQVASGLAQFRDSCIERDLCPCVSEHSQQATLSPEQRSRSYHSNDR